MDYVSQCSIIWCIFNGIFDMEADYVNVLKIEIFDLVYSLEFYKWYLWNSCDTRIFGMFFEEKCDKL